MNFFRQIRKALVTIGLVVMLSTVITFSFAPGKSWANTLLTPSMDQPHALVAAINQAQATAKKIEGKAQEGIGNMTGNLKTQAAGKVKQFDADTQEAILESMDNPNYKPEGQGLRKRDREAVECLEGDVSDCFNQTQGAD